MNEPRADRNDPTQWDLWPDAFGQSIEVGALVAVTLIEMSPAVVAVLKVTAVKRLHPDGAEILRRAGAMSGADDRPHAHIEGTWVRHPVFNAGHAAAVVFPERLIVIDKLVLPDSTFPSAEVPY